MALQVMSFSCHVWSGRSRNVRSCAPCGGIQIRPVAIKTEPKAMSSEQNRIQAPSLALDLLRALTLAAMAGLGTALAAGLVVVLLATIAA